VSSLTALDDGLPLVGEDGGNRGLWLGLGGIGLAGVLLFLGLNANRQSEAAQPVPSPKDYAVATAPKPGLFIPDYVLFGPPIRIPQNTAPAKPALRPTIQPPRLPPVRLSPTPRYEGRPAAPTIYAPVSYPPLPIVSPSAVDPGRFAPTIVYDVAGGAQAARQGGELFAPSARISPAIASAAVDRSNLVSQGTLIYAVLETALDSTQSGQARAIISNNVYNAAGTKVLIPKGSRVFGEYKGEISAGQNRAQVIWGRLIRPDGVTINLDSPASDPLGRAGVKGRVDTHFGERLVNAVLQSAIDFGAAAATRAVTSNNGIILALPNVSQRAGSEIVQSPPKPTLKVRHGTRIAVFVSRDLDFSAVE
jgi:type IV secretion system protein VirB10